MEAALLHASPLTDLTPHGPEGPFGEQRVDAPIVALDAVRATAAGGVTIHREEPSRGRDFDLACDYLSISRLTNFQVAAT